MRSRKHNDDSDMEPGKIGWIDITVDDAAGLRDFYANVTGWKYDEVSMGDYADYSDDGAGERDCLLRGFVMHEAVTRSCHASG